MNEVLAVCLVLVLATSSYAAGRLHAQLGYRLGFRSGYRQGFGDGDRAARLHERRDVVAGSAPMVAEVPTVAEAPTVAARATAAAPATATASPAAPDPSGAPAVDPTARAVRSAAPVGGARAVAPGFDPRGGGVPRLPSRALEHGTTNRAAVMRGTMYHSTGMVGARGGRHAHPE